MSFDSWVWGENEEENIALWCIRAINICMEQMLAVGNASANKHFHWGLIWPHNKEKETESFRCFFWIKVAVGQTREWARWRPCYRDKTNLLASLKCPMILSQWIHAWSTAWKVVRNAILIQGHWPSAFCLLFISQSSIPPFLSLTLATLSRYFKAWIGPSSFPCGSSVVQLTQTINTGLLDSCDD